MYIYIRDLEKKIFPKYIDSEEIVVITGMRRTGKTTICRSIFKKIKSANKIFLDIENPIDQKLFEEDDFNNIITNLSEKYGLNPLERIYIFLDEVQSSPEIIHSIKYLHDHFKVKFILTGSSSFYLKNLFPESLAGRKIVFELYPLNFDEFLTFKGSSRTFHYEFPEKEVKKEKVLYEKYKYLYEEFLKYGGFPGVVTAKTNEDKIERLEDIYKSYFQKEVQVLSEFRDIKSFRDLMFILIQRVGSKLDIRKLSSELGISRPTVDNYLAFLESTYFMHFISPYSTNVDREVSGTKKVYVCDTGIANHFAKLDQGNVFENAVFLALKKYSNKVNYFQKRSGAEIDFVLPEKDMTIEVKIKGTERDFQKLRKTSSGLGIPKNYIITKEFREFPGSIPAMAL